jgi:flagellar assembly protein FliH
MSIFPLEEFSTKILSDDPKLMPETSFEEHRLEAYEQGYKAGWDDAATAQAEDNTRISADFARNLQELSFTYHEAKGQILESLEPLLKEMVVKILPAIAEKTLAHSIASEVLKIAKNHADINIEIVVSPLNRPALEALLENQNNLEISIVDEASMAHGLAYIRFANTEKQIDFESVLSRYLSLVDGFFEQQKKVASNE